MQKITIGNGIEVSKIALGGGHRSVPKNEEVYYTIMDRYLEHGGNFFDSARAYGNGYSDQSLGRWIAERNNRDKIVICTKGSSPYNESKHVNRLSPKEIVQDLDESLSYIKTDYTDVHILHRDDPTLPVSDIMITLDNEVKKGKIKAIGASNWTVGRINEANIFAKENGLTPFTIAQVFFSLGITTPAQTKDITHCIMNDIEYLGYKELGINLMAYCVQARGYFHRMANNLPIKPALMNYFGYYPENERRAKRLVQLSKETGYSVSALAMAYINSKSTKTIPLCGFSNLEQLEDTLAAQDFILSQEQIDFLEGDLKLK